VAFALLRFSILESLALSNRRNIPEKLPPDTIARFKAAQATWKAFLLGQRPHPGAFQQHLLPLKEIAEISNPSDYLSPNLNRYFMRTIDMDLCNGRNTNYVYSKLGRFVIIGFVREDSPNFWKGTKVHVKDGRIEPRKYTVPDKFFKYMNTKARKILEGQDGISSRQLAKIEKSFRENMDNYRGSDDFIAMENDVRMFGKAAFTGKGSSEEETP
jgi:hypothetical protein